MSADVPQLSVWRRVGSEWRVTGDIGHDALNFDVRDRDIGTWSATMPLGSESAKLELDRLVTIRFREAMPLPTWLISPRTRRSDEAGSVLLEVGGFDALALLTRPSAWPDPSAALTPVGTQPAEGDYSGPAETVIRSLVAENLRDRLGYPLVCPASQGRGGQVSSRPRFDPLLDEVLRKARRGGIGVRLGLVPTTSDTRAELRLSFYVPRDRTTRVRLAASDGSMASWSLTETAPTCTVAIVGGAGEGAQQYLRRVDTTVSQQQTGEWGGIPWERYTDGPETFDNPPLDDAGAETLDEGAATESLEMQAAEPAGTLAFRDFVAGDLVTAVPIPSVEAVAGVSAIQVAHTADAGLSVTPMFGDPDADRPDVQTAQIIRRLRADLARMRTRRKRGTA